MICGTSDPIISQCRSFNTQLQNSGAHSKLIEVNGVGHTGAYYFSGQFTTDWNSCYDFVMSFIPKPGKITLTSPLSGQQDVEIPVLLEWQEEATATSYEVEINDDNGLVERKTPKTNSVSIKNLEPGKEYSWMVRGINSGGEGEWSYEWWFTTKPNPPSAQVSLLEPTDGATNLGKNIDFKWSVIPEAKEYQIQVLNEADSIVKEYDKILPEEDGTVIKTIRNLELGASYKWQVRGKNSSGESPWSEQWTFSTAPSPPGIALLLEPLHNAIEISTLPLFKWNRLENAGRYHFQLVKFDTDEIIVEDTSITLFGGDSIVYQITEELDGKTKYKWHVTGINDGGKGAWSEFRIFTTWDPSDVEENDFSSIETNIFPSPFNSVGYIQIYSEEPEEIEIQLHNVYGQRIISLGFFDLTIGYNKILLDLKSLPNGLHFLTIRGKFTFEVKGFVIQR